MHSIVARRWQAMSPPRRREPIKAGECPFDSIGDGTSPAHIVLDEPALLGFLDIRPVFPGHTLVIPKRHWTTLAELPSDLLGPMLEAGRRVAMAQRDALGAEGTFYAFNDVVSQSVPHVHLHVVPRRRGDGLRGFFWPRTRYEGVMEAEAVATLLRDALATAPTSSERSE